MIYTIFLDDLMKTEVRWNKSNVNYYCHHHRYYNYRAGLLERYTRRMRITYTKKEKRKKSKWRIIKKSCILIWYTLHTWNTLIDVWLSVWVLSKTLRIFFNNERRRLNSSAYPFLVSRRRIACSQCIYRYKKKRCVFKMRIDRAMK